MIVTIDRIIEQTAVTEMPDGTMLDVPLRLFPDGLAEGDAVEITIRGDIRNERTRNIKKQMDRLFKD